MISKEHASDEIWDMMCEDTWHDVWMEYFYCTSYPMSCNFVKLCKCENPEFRMHKMLSTNPIPRRTSPKCLNIIFTNVMSTTECYQTYLKCAVNDFSDKWYTGESMKSMFFWKSFIIKHSQARHRPTDSLKKYMQNKFWRQRAIWKHFIFNFAHSSDNMSMHCIKTTMLYYILKKQFIAFIFLCLCYF